MVKSLEKELEKPHLADRDKDGKLSGWEKAVGKKIEASKKGKGKETGEYKSDRGNKKIPFKEVKKAGMCKNSMCKNIECAGECKSDGGVSSSTTGMSKPRHSDEKVKKHDLTSEIIAKYQQESGVENVSPQFIDYSGGTAVEAKPYQTNGTIPFYTEKAPASSPISEKAKIFAFAKTGYDEKGSGLHLQYNQEGGERSNGPNLAPIEDSLATLNKMGGDSGLLNEIAFLIEQIGNHQ